MCIVGKLENPSKTIKAEKLLYCFRWSVKPRLCPQLQQLQVTDGNYTVAWLVADEDDGAGYYEDDDDDQVKHGAHQHYDSLDLFLIYE